MESQRSDPSLLSSTAEDAAPPDPDAPDRGVTASESEIVTIPRWAAFLTTTVAITLVVVHLVFPSLRIDAASLILLAIAALPWIGPVIKSVRVGPVELNQLRVASEHLRSDLLRVKAEVAEVHRLVIRGATPAQEARLNSDIDHYRKYLSRIGVPARNLVDAPVNVEDKPEDVGGHPQMPMVSAYRDGAIYLLKAAADSPTVAMREYTHHAFEADRIPGEQATHPRLLESGLAFYLPCSFLGDSSWGAGAPEFIHDISQPAPSIDDSASDIDRYSAGGLCWAHWLWTLRETVGPNVIDPVVVSAWFADEGMTMSGTGDMFVALICSHLGSENAHRAERVLAAASICAGMLDQRSRDVSPA